MIVHVIRDERSSPDYPLGDAVETLVRREDAERFIEEVHGDDPELASYLDDRSGGAHGPDRSPPAPICAFQGAITPSSPQGELNNQTLGARLLFPRRGHPLPNPLRGCRTVRRGGARRRSRARALSADRGAGARGGGRG